MPQRGIQGALETNCIPLWAGSKAHQSPSDSRNSTVVTARAIRLALRSPPRSTGTTPASGRSTNACRIQRSYPIDCSSWVIDSPDHDAENPNGADEEEHDVQAHLAGLKSAAE